jgi:hypothetical protein
MKLKIIREDGRVFLIRVSIPFGKKSVKVHVILNDDKGKPHKHPWDFKNILLVGAYKEEVDRNFFLHKPLTIIKRKAYQRHLISLYRVFGIRIPCVTLGLYSEKKAPWCEREHLCDACLKFGGCQDKRRWENQNDEVLHLNALSRTVQ